jgi:hypothetical protein
MKSQFVSPSLLNWPQKALPHNWGPAIALKWPANVSVMVRSCHATKSALRLLPVPPPAQPTQLSQDAELESNMLSNLSSAASFSRVRVGTTSTGMRGLVSQQNIAPGATVLCIPWYNVLAVPKYREVQQLWTERFLEPFQAAHGQQLPVALQNLLSTGKQDLFFRHAAECTSYSCKSKAAICSHKYSQRLGACIDVTRQLPQG